MAIAPGARLGPYEIETRVGAGGMGEVYRARDTRLDRTVAIKVLRSHLSEDGGLRERFEREARAVSSLNHPNICTLHDIGRENGIDFIVMEYLEGESLAGRLEKGKLSLDEVIEYGIQIAAALEKAHRQGIVHRDLKPGNIMITKSGAKLLDFGLAKLGLARSAGDDNLSALPTEARDLTEEGALLGTFPYMAPEQLEGKDVDARTDVFALGAVLYEIVTGHKAFEGSSRASLIAAILERTPPPLRSRQPLTPPALEHLVARCLAKDPDERWQSAGDLVHQLKWIAGASAEIPVGSADKTKKRSWIWHAATGLAVALVTALTVWSFRTPEPDHPVRFIVDPSPTQFYLANDPNLAISPDGSRIVFGGNDARLYLRRLEQFEATAIPDTQGAHGPFFSPDGEWIGFFSDGDRTLRKVRLDGSSSVRICEVDEGHLGASWGEDDTIVFSSLDAGLARVSSSGGTPESFTRPEAGSRHEFPEILPGGSGVLFTIRQGPGSENVRIALVRADALEPVSLVSRGAGARYSSTGHLLYGDGGRIMAVPFDLDHGETSGSATPVVTDVMPTADGPLNFSLSKDGTLVYAPGAGAFLLGELVWVDRDGTHEPAAEGRLGYGRPRLSPDGRRLVVELGGALNATDLNRDLWIYDLERGSRSRLTFDGVVGDAVWTRDGRRVVYRSGTGLYWRRWDGSGPPELLLEGPTTLNAHSWSPDGNILAYYEIGQGDRDIWILPLGGDREPEPFLVTDFNERSPSFSPDGRWLAYVSNETGLDEIYLRPYPGPGAKVTVSTAGGREPVWCPAGGELFYRSGEQMLAVPVETGKRLEVGTPHVLFEGEYLTDLPLSGSQSYDVTPNCERFLMISGDEPTVTGLRVVLHWHEELKRLMPTNH